MTAGEMVEKRLPDSVYLGAVPTPEGKLTLLIKTITTRYIIQISKTILN